MLEVARPDEMMMESTGTLSPEPSSMTEMNR
jgi:hypothetical protein